MDNLSPCTFLYLEYIQTAWQEAPQSMLPLMGPLVPPRISNNHYL